MAQTLALKVAAVFPGDRAMVVLTVSRHGGSSAPVKSRALLSAILLALLAVPSPGAIKASRPDYWVMAQKALQGGDTDGALDALDALLKDDPEHAQGRLWRARILGDRDQVDEALGDVEVASRLEPNNPLVYAQRGFLRQKHGKFDEAIADFNRALRMNPQDDWSLYCRGLIFAQRGDRAAALADLDASLELNPKNVGAWLGRGQVHLRLGDAEKAETDFAEGARLEPKNPAGHVGLGAVYYATGRFERAIEAFSIAVRQAPEDSRPLTQRGYAYAAMNKDEEARKDFDAALKIDPKEVTALVGRGELSRMQKRWSDAIADYSAALEAEPNDFRARMGRASAHYASKDYERAISDYADAVQRFPNEPQAANDYAWLLATGLKDSIRDGAKAVELARIACKLTEYKYAAFLDTLAAAHAEKGEWDDAVKWQQEAVKYSNQEPEDIKKQMAERVDLYRQKQPYREDPVTLFGP